MNNRIDAIYARQSVDKKDSISIKSMYALTDSSRQRPRMAMWKCALMDWKCLSTGLRANTMWAQRKPESIS